jgi:lysophospholipase L1-like esterase
MFVTLLAGLLLSLICRAEDKPSLDWPNLAAYEKANIKVKAQSPGTVKVVFMGDSITEFWTPNFWNESRVNRGISGQTTPQMLLRFRSDVLELKPKVVVILAGTNDVAENTGPARVETIIGNIVSMVELAQTNGLKVVLGSILPAAEFPWNKALKPAEKIMALNRNLRAYAMQKQLTFVDYFSEMVDDKNGLRLEYSEDGVHPNKAGYDVMERLVTQALAVHLKAEQ